MWISIDWIKDFVDLEEISSKDLGEKVTLSTAEVEEVLEEGGLLEQVRVAQIVGIRKHPQADQLNLVTFLYEEGKTKEVVCGAPNVREGLKVPYAKIGTAFPNGLVLEPKKIRGIVSEGMLCSRKELGLGEDQAGLMELGEEAVIGQSLNSYLGEKRDVLLNIDNKSLTHRPDLWGHYGFAREVATIFHQQLKNPYHESWKRELQKKQTSQKSPIIPRLEGESSCLVYYGLSMSGIKVQESPQWMQQRLKKVGVRPINNIVDISNYCMLELGIPMHMFDLDLIDQNQIVIKRVGGDSPVFFTTLDGVERTLLPHDTVIVDANGPLVLGGIMGGKRCEVSEKTSRIFIEVANWKASEVRKTSSRLGLRTDSSQRYEKSLDSWQCELTLWRAVELVLLLCPDAKVEGKLEGTGPHFEQFPPQLKLKTSYSSINKKLGLDIDRKEIGRIFTSLGFGIEDQGEKGEQLLIAVPSFRSTKDVEMEADLVEEIGRMVGYDHIPPAPPLGSMGVTRLGQGKTLQRKVRDFMVLQGQALEITTYPLLGEKLLKKSEWGHEENPLLLQNPIAVDYDRMRPSLIPSLLEVSALNQKYYDQFRLFELGRSYRPGGKEFAQEFSQLGVGFYSKQSPVIKDVINVMEKLLAYLKLPAELVEGRTGATTPQQHPNPWIPQTWVGRHPHEYMHVRIMGKWAGAITTIHPLVLKNFKMGGHLTLAILDLTPFENMNIKERFQYSPLPKAPSSVFDCTVVAPGYTPVGEIIKCCRKIKLKELKSTHVVDVYPLSSDQKTVTLSFVFQDPEQTLSGDFLKKAKDLVVETLAKGGFPLKMA